MLWSDLKQTGEPVSACEQSGYSVFNASRSSSVMHTRGLNWVNASMIDGLEGGSGGMSRAEGGGWWWCVASCRSPSHRTPVASLTSAPGGTPSVTFAHGLRHVALSRRPPRASSGLYTFWPGWHSSVDLPLHAVRSMLAWSGWPRPRTWPTSWVVIASKSKQSMHGCTTSKKI